MRLPVVPTYDLPGEAACHVEVWHRSRRRTGSCPDARGGGRAHACGQPGQQEHHPGPASLEGSRDLHAPARERGTRPADRNDAERPAARWIAQPLLYAKAAEVSTRSCSTRTPCWSSTFNIGRAIHDPDYVFTWAAPTAGHSQPLQPPVIRETFTSLPCPKRPQTTVALEACSKAILRTNGAINAQAKVIVGVLKSLGPQRDVRSRRSRGCDADRGRAPPRRRSLRVATGPVMQHLHRRAQPKSPGRSRRTPKTLNQLL